MILRKKLPDDFRVAGVLFLILVIWLAISSLIWAQDPESPQIWVAIPSQEATSKFWLWAEEQALAGNVELPSYAEIRDGQIVHKKNGAILVAKPGHGRLGRAGYWAAVEIFGIKTPESRPSDGYLSYTHIPLDVYNQYAQDTRKDTIVTASSSPGPLPEEEDSWRKELEDLAKSMARNILDHLKALPAETTEEDRLKVTESILFETLWDQYGEIGDPPAPPAPSEQPPPPPPQEDLVEPKPENAGKPVPVDEGAMSEGQLRQLLETQKQQEALVKQPLPPTPMLPNPKPEYDYTRIRWARVYILPKYEDGQVVNGYTWRQKTPEMGYFEKGGYHYLPAIDDQGRMYFHPVPEEKNR